MKRNIICLLTILSLCPAVLLAADGDWLTQFRQQFQAFWQKEQPQKVYLQTDRTFYVASDTVWFKAYVTDAQTNLPRPVPEVIYLDLISPGNVSFIAQRLNVENGFAQGSLVLPDTLKAGNYALQAYTNWQRNSGSNTFFRQQLWINTFPVLNGKTVVNSPQKVLKDLQLFPEGGSLMAGLESKVSFKALAVNGQEIPVNGKILDEKGNVISNFQSNFLGTGSFRLKPQANKTYLAQVKIGSEVRNFPLLPASKGYALSVKNLPDSVSVILGATPGELQKPVYLALQSHGNLLVSDSVMFNARGFRKRVFSTKSWPEGVVQAALLNAQGLPERERLFFHAQAQQLRVKIETFRKTYGRRENVPVTISLQDENGKPVQTELSVSVTNGLQLPVPTLRTNLLLTSEVTGWVPDPDVYFNNPEARDNFLISNQPRTFTWEKLLKPTEISPAYARETDNKLKGKVVENGAIISQAVIYLLETNSGKTYVAMSDKDGIFTLPANGTRFFYQIWQGGINHKDARLALSHTETLLPETGTQLTLAPDSALTERALLRRKIESVYKDPAKITKAQKLNPNLWPPYQADKYFTLADYNELGNMEEIIRGIIPVARVTGKKNDLYANLYNEDTRDFYKHQPLYIIDGQPTWNNDLFLRLDGSQIDQVNVYNSDKSLQPFGFMGSQGVIVVFTKSRNFLSPELKTENILNVPGQNAASNFKVSTKPANVPDFRPTLYWNPTLQTNQNGKASFSFFTSDEMGNLRIQVEGITKDGKIISQQLTVPVQPAE